MARLQEPKITGTIGNITVYRRGGKLFMRSKSSLSAERVKTDPAFAPTMWFAGILAMGSRISSKVYGSLKKKDKKRYTHQFLTGKAMKLLKEEMNVSQARHMMEQLYGTGRSFTNTGLVQAAPVTQQVKNNMENRLPLPGKSTILPASRLGTEPPLDSC